MTTDTASVMKSEYMPRAEMRAVLLPGAPIKLTSICAMLILPLTDRYEGCCASVQQGYTERPAGVSLRHPRGCEATRPLN